nr:hypothetical protein [Cupriavidus necator]
MTELVRLSATWIPVRGLAEQVHARTQTALFRRFARRLSKEEQHRLDRLLTREFACRQTAYHKRHALRPSRKHVSLLIEHLTWLDAIGDFLGLWLVFLPRSRGPWRPRP